MAVIVVKDWWYKQEQSKSMAYNWTLCNSSVCVSKKGCFLYDSNREGVDCKHVGFAISGDKIKETEKAVYVCLSFWNINKSGRYVTDAPVEKRWKTWIPKSVIIKG